MNAHDPKLEQRLAELRGVAEPMPADKRRVLESVRAVLDLQSGSPPAVGEPKAIERSLKQGRARVAPAARATARSLRPWLGGALIGGVVGLSLGLRLGRVDERSTDATKLDRSGVAQAASAGSASSSSELSASASTAQVSTPSSARGAARDDSGASQPGAAHELARRVPARKMSRAGASAARLGTDPRAADESIDLALALELLQRAEQALHASEPQLALGVLSDLDRRAARSLLREERLTTSALVLCELDRPDEARAAREELQREFPGSIYAPRLGQSCATGSAAPDTPQSKIAPGSAKSRDRGH